jgi:5'-deoxynucleotidase YfbR-like HD superfamily hydrolase
VRRYHTAPVIRTQTVSEHSWAVAQLALWVAPACRREVLVAALNHDLPELHTGDLPAPVKWDNPLLGDYLAKVEQTFHDDNGTHVTLTAEEQHLLKWCDMAELVAWCFEEFEMGNKRLLPVILRGLQYLQTHGHPNDKAKRLFNEFTKRWNHAGQ